MNNPILETPEALVERGRIHSGFFKLPFRKVNMLSADRLGGVLGRPFRWWRLKEWVGFGISHPELFGGILVQDAKLTASGTAYFYDRRERRMNEWLVVEPSVLCRIPESLWQGETRCGHGRSRVWFDHDLTRGRHEIHASFPQSGGKPPMRVDLVAHQDLARVEPLVVSLPIEPDHHTYTHKAPLRLEGTIRIGAREFHFDPDRDLANLDEQKTFYPYKSDWRWGCFGTRTQGREVMVNFVNQMTPLDMQGEDALWVDGRLSLLARPEIVQVRPGEFRIEDPEGRLKLRFQSHGAKVEKLNLGPVTMDYEQAYGPYSGEVVTDSGERLLIDGAFGALERMDARF